MLNSPKVIDTFLFAEPHESDLLYIKFKLEDPHVDTWIIQENNYTLQGDFKENFAKEILKEERFKPYLHKVIIISASELLFPGQKEEGINFVREGWQRNLCRKFLLENFSGNDIVLISDTDEMIDFSDDKRAERFWKISDQHQSAYIGRMRYWFDYDNRCYLPNIRIPFIRVKHININSNALSQVRHSHGTTYDAGEDPIAFEYSYVFKSLEDVWRKKQTYSHTNFTLESVQTALECNHWPRSKERGEKLMDNPYDLFEKVKLTEQNSPKYVRENLDSLRTGIVSENYKENRKERYGI